MKDRIRIYDNRKKKNVPLKEKQNKNIETTNTDDNKDR